MPTIYDFTADAIDGGTTRLSDFNGKALLVVNTASKCGFTPQYAGLEMLQQDFGPRGFAVLGFPCNQFGAQEPGDAGEIGSFCTLAYNVTFPMFARIDVNGANAHPLFAFLKKARPGLLGSEGIKWNFTKFLIDRSGAPVARYAPTVKPEEIRTDIEAVLGE